MCTSCARTLPGYFVRNSSMPSIYYYLCLLCSAAVIGEEAVKETPASVPNHLIKPPEPSSDPPKPTGEVQAAHVLEAAQVLDADSRATILGELEKAKKLETAAPAKPEEAATVSTTLQNAVTAKPEEAAAVSTTLENAVTAKPEEPVTVSTTLENAITAKPEAAATALDKAVASTRAVANETQKGTSETNRTQTIPVQPAPEPVCADKVVVKHGEDLEPDCMGVFRKTNIKPTKDHAFRTIYRNKRGKHLYYWKPASNWIIEGEGHYDTSYGALFSHMDTRCPEMAKDWKIWEEEGWTSRRGITVTVVTPNSTDDEEGDDDDIGDWEETDLKEDAGEIEIVRFDSKAVDREPTPGSLMRLPLIAALLSFTGVVAYSLVFLFKIFKRRKTNSPIPKAKSGRANDELDFEDLECAFDVATSKKADLPLRKKVHSKVKDVKQEVQSKVKEAKQVLATALEPDDAGWGDDIGWDDIADDLTACG